ncbi:MAG: SpoIIE family protein phosphatase [Clostridiales Family XIII bacterium]|jgi:serine phosphatase RsbU (regulator of sigma subunit)/anti-sigma regulatory factor (Ser/Thr protein kinase)|nr:SpoIIE family protein phosphatase [Clostridiales Family XIII bacterium]
MIRKRITIAFLLVSLISLLASGILSLVQLNNIRGATEESFIETAYEDLQSLTDETGRVIDRRLKKYSDELSILNDYVSDIYTNPDQYLPVDVTSPYDVPRDALELYYFPDPGAHVNMDEVGLLGNVKTVFESMKATFPEIDSLYFTSDDGANLQYDNAGHSAPETIIEDEVAMRGRPWYVSAKKTGGTVISDVYENITGNGETVTFSASVFSGGAFKGVIGMDILTKNLNRELAMIAVGKSGSAELITDPDAPLVDDPDMLVATSELKFTDWTVLYAIPRSEVTAPVKAVDDRVFHLVLLFSALLTLILALTALAANLYAKRISIPLTALAVEKERISAELDVATNIQSSMLPHIFPPFPHRKEIDIYGVMDPAREIGGDFYDFFLIDDRTLAVVIADVSGKGVPAALFMVIAKTLLSNYALMDKSPKEVFETVNNTLCENNDEGLFVTCFMGYLDLETGEFVSVNAGHNPPLLKQGGVYGYYKTKRGLVLAGMENSAYEESRAVLAPGDVLYFYTDGVTEADNKSKELYGEQRLLETLNKNTGADIEELCADIRQSVEVFADGAQQADDITMLAIRFNGKKERIRPRGECMDELTIEAKLENLEQVLAFVESHTGDFPEKSRYHINIAVDEIFTNISSYAYENETGTVVIRVKVNDTVMIEFEDSGVPYDPTAQETPELTQSADEREIGGLGVFMTKKMMDTVEYRREGSKNILTLKKGAS